MAITKVSRGLLNTGISDSSDATAITIDSSENVTMAGDIVLGAGKAIKYNDDRYFMPENNVDGAEISANGIFKVKTGSTPTERMRIDASGKVFIATTSAARTTAGHEFHTDGFARHTVDGDKSMEFVRTSSFGEMVEFFKDTSLIGSIGAYTTGRLYIGSGDTAITFASTERI